MPITSITVQGFSLSEIRNIRTVAVYLVQFLKAYRLAMVCWGMSQLSVPVPEGTSTESRAVQHCV